MIGLGIALGYFIGAVVTARLLFVKILGDSPRTNSAGTATSRKFDDAVFFSLMFFLFWPLTLIFLWVTAKTPHERNQSKLKLMEERNKKMEADNRRIRQMAKDAGLPTDVWDN